MPSRKPTYPHLGKRKIILVGDVLVPWVTLNNSYLNSCDHPYQTPPKGCFPKIEVPQNGWFMILWWKTLLKMDDLRGFNPLFSENIHILTPPNLRLTPCRHQIPDIGYPSNGGNFPQQWTTIDLDAGGIREPSILSQWVSLQTIQSIPNHLM